MDYGTKKNEPVISPAKPGLILFDVYETLLDMSAVEKRVNTLLDSKRGYTIWFELFMQYCFVDNCISQFNPFPDIGRATLQMAAKMLGENPDKSDIEVVLQLLEHCPVKEGIAECLSQLHDQGFRIAALTNSAQQIVESRMERTGLISYFEKVLSAEHVGKYKPSPEVYQWATDQLNIKAEDVLSVSSHSWDIAGAHNAGMQTAYIMQESQILYPLAPTPNLVVASIEKLSIKLKELFA